MNIHPKIQSLKKTIIETRRDFHKHPELSFQEKRTAKIVAEKLESFGINVLVDKKSHLYIKETTIGWSNELQDKGFKFDNPHAKGACGCKTSFQIDMDSVVTDKEKTPSWME